MRQFKRILIAVACLLAAIGCYVFGIPAGGIAFLVLGVIFEGMFWLSILGKKRNQ